MTDAEQKEVQRLAAMAASRKNLVDIKIAEYTNYASLQEVDTVGRCKREAHFLLDGYFDAFDGLQALLFKINTASPGDKK